MFTPLFDFSYDLCSIFVWGLVIVSICMAIDTMLNKRKEK